MPSRGWKSLIFCAFLFGGTLPFSPAQAQAPDDPSGVIGVQLHAEMREAVVREGETAYLELRADNLLPGTSLEVRLRVGTGYVFDVLLGRSTLELTAAEPSGAVSLQVLADNRAEPRETVLIRAEGVGDVAAVTASLVIPRNGYTVQELQLSSQEVSALSVATVQVETVLNAVVPSAVRLVVQAVLQGEGLESPGSAPGAFTLTAGIDIAKDERSGRTSLLTPTGGLYGFSLERAEFLQAESLDQRNLLEDTPGPTAQLRVVVLGMLPGRVVFSEGESTTLTVNVTGLPVGESMDVYIESGQPVDASLPSPLVWRLLRAEASTALVTVRALADGLPEPREEIALRVNSQDVPPGAMLLARPATLVIPRHGYEVTELRAPPAAAAGDRVQLEAVLNAPAPSTVSLTVQVELREENGDEANTSPTVLMKIARGESRGSSSFVLQEAGAYDISPGIAEFTHTAPGDQRILPLRAPPLAPLQVGPKQLTLRLRYTGGNLVHEGELYIFLVTVEELPADGTMKIRLHNDAPGDVEIFPENHIIPLQGEEPGSPFFPPEGPFLVDALEDNLPEPREEIRIGLSVVETSFTAEAMPVTASLMIPRHGYVVTDLQLTPVTSFYTDEATPMAEVAFNAAIPGDVELQLQVTLPDGGLSMQTLQVLAGASTVHTGIELRGGGVYRVQVGGARFLEVEAGDQEFLELRTQPASFEALQASLEISVNRTLFSEGDEDGRLRLRARHLRPGEGLDVVLSQNEEGVYDVALNRWREITLTERFPEYDVGFWVLPDNEKEPRETVTVTARGTPLNPGHVTVPATVTASVSFDIATTDLLRLDVLEDWAREGESVQMRVEAFGLRAGQRREVGFSAEPSGAVRFSERRVVLTHSMPVRIIPVEVVDDEEPERSQTVVLRAWSVRFGGLNDIFDDDNFIIPFNDYAVSDVEISPREPRVNEPFTAEFLFNGRVPLPVAAGLRLRLLDPQLPLVLTSDLRILRGQARGSVPLVLPAAGEWQVEIVRLLFLGSEDQNLAPDSDLETPLPVTILRVLPPFALELVPAEGQLQEGEMTPVQVRALHLQTGDSLEAGIHVAQENRADLFLHSSTISLTAAAPTGTVWVTALADGIPEPRESVELTAAAADASSATALLMIPRHGYELVALHVPQEGRRGVPFTVRAELNAVAPVTATVQVQLAFSGAGSPQTEALQILPGASSGSLSFTPQEAGLYVISSLDARFPNGESGDQLQLDGDPAAVQTQVLALPALRLQPQQQTVAEGGSVQVQVQALNLMAGDSLQAQLQVAAGHDADLVLQPASVSLTAEASTVQVQLRAVDDSVAEPRERVEFTVTAAGAGSARAWLWIPRNGYELTALHAPLEVRRGLPFTVRAVLNAVAPQAVQVELQLMPPGSGVPQTEALQIPAGESSGSVSFIPPETGVYMISPLDARFSNGESGDQLQLGGTPAVLQTRVLGPPVLGLQLQRQTAAEGDSVQAQVQALKLLAGDTLQAQLQVGTEHDADLVLTPDSVSLTAVASTAQVQLRAVDDGVAEPRERVELTVTAAGVNSTRVWLVIPRNGYALTALHAPQETRRSLPFTVRAVLNAVAPQTVQVELQMSFIGSGVSQTEALQILPGVSSGSVSFIPPEAGVYVISAPDAHFSNGETGDQLQLDGDPAVLQIRVVGPPVLYLQLQRQTVAEGGSVRAWVQALSLLAEESLQAGLQVATEHDADLVLTPASVSLTAAASTARVQIWAVDDGVAEPRERVELTVTAPGAGLARSFLDIPRNGYALTVLGAPQETRRGLPFTVRAELNAVAPQAVRVQLQITPPGSGTPQTEALQIQAGASSGSVSYTPPEAGVYVISALDARFLNGETGDQLQLDGDPAAVQTRVLGPPALRLQLQRQTVAEGGSVRARVQAFNLLAGEGLEVQLQVAAAYRPDLVLQLDSVLLTAAASTARVQIWVLDDGVAEPRERVELTVTAPGAGSARSWLWIPRNDYALTALHAPQEARQGLPFTVRAELNAVAPQAVQVQLQLTAPDPGVPQTELLQVQAGASSGSVSFTPQEAGVYVISSLDARFQEGESGDQLQLEGAPAAVQTRVLGPPALRLQLQRQTVAEGGSVRARVQALNLLAGAGLEAQLQVAAAYRADLLLQLDSVSLTAAASTAQVQLRAVDDGVAEPRERVELTVTAAGAGSARAFLDIPRNDYALTVLGAPQEARRGLPFTVRAELNAVAPQVVQVELQISPPGSGASQTEALQIQAGESSGSVSFTPPEAGVYVISVLDARFQEGESGDQLQLDGDPAAVQTRVLGPPALGLQLQRQTVPEGGSVRAQVQVLKLLAGEGLEAQLQVAAAYRADLVLTPASVSLTAEASTAQVQLRVVDDGEAEPRERVELTVTAAGAASARAFLDIPRNGYALTALHAPQEARRGLPFTVRAELNAVAPQAVQVRLRVTPPGSGAPQTELLQVQPGDSSGSLSFTPQEAGVYVISALDARFQEGEAGDQLQLEGDPAAVQTRVLGPPVLGLQLQRQTVAEGDSVRAQVQALKLLAEEGLEAQLQVAEAYRADLVLGSDSVSLTAEASTAQVQLRVVDDGEAEPRERVELTVTAAGAASARSFLDIPRNGYALTELHAPQEARRGQPFTVRAQLNAVAPQAVQLQLQITPPGSGAPQTGSLQILPGDSSGSLSYTPQEAGVYVISALDARFQEGESGDQLQLEGDPAAVQTRVLGPPALRWQLQRQTVTEGGSVRAWVQALNLLAGEGLEAQLQVATGHEADLLLQADSVSLTAEASTARVQIWAVDDGVAEPRERVELTVTAAGAASARSWLWIPRNGYALTELHAPQEARRGLPFTVRAEINAVAPQAVQVQLRVTPPGSGTPQTELLQVQPGASSGSLSFTPQEAGVYVISALDARFQEGETGDQLQLEGDPAAVQTRVLGPPVLGLQLQRQTVAEGGSVRARVQVMKLLAGEELEAQLQVATEHDADLLLQPDSVSLTAEASTAQVQLRVVDDGEAEPRERVELTVTASGAGSARAFLDIPRNGYALTELHAPQEARRGLPFTVRAVLNAVAPQAVQVQLRVTPPGSGAPQTELLQIEPGVSSGSLSFTPQEAGVYIISALDARFQEGETGDQLQLEGDPAAVQTRVLGPPVLGLQLQRQTVAEGGSVRAEVQVLKLLAGEGLEAQLQVAEAYRADLLLGAGSVSLTAEASTAQVQLGVVDDGEAEPRERVELTVTAAGAASARAFLDIPRNGYALTVLGTPQEARRGVPFTVRAELNAVAPQAVQVQLRVTPPGSGAPQTELLQLEPRVSSGSLSYTPQEAGVYIISALDARFPEGEAGDQLQLEGDPAAVQVRVLALPALRLQLQRQTVAEGGSVQAQVQALNLLAGDTLQAQLRVAAAYSADLLLQTDSVSLTAEASTAQVQLRVVDDGVAEPRERVELTVTAAGAGSARALLWIPRHDYALTELHAPQEARQGLPFTVRAELNAVAPQAVQVQLQMTPPGSGAPQTELLQLQPGASSGSLSFTPQEAGMYVISALDARFQNGETGDQLLLSQEGLNPLSVQVKMQQLVLQAELENGELAEGEMTILRLRVEGLLAGETLGVRIDSDHPQDLQLHPSVLTLAGPSWSAEVEVRALPDAEPEPGEEVRIGVDVSPPLPPGVRVTTAQAVLRIPLHGYRLQALRLSPPESHAGALVQVETELNASAPEDWRWTVQAVLLDERGREMLSPVPGVDPLEVQLQILKGQTTGQAQMRPVKTGLYEVSLLSPDAGQPVLPVPPSVLLRVHPLQVSLWVQLDRQTLALGRTAHMQVGAMNRPAGEDLELLISTDHPEDLAFTPGHLVLTAAERTATVMLRVLENEGAPPRFIAQVEVRALTPPAANWVASPVQVSLEVLRERLPPSIPELQGAVLGPYELWVSWTRSMKQLFAGEALRAPLVAPDAYTLLYAESAPGACPAAPGDYAAAAVPTGELRALVRGYFSDGRALQANTGYCLVLRVRDGEHTVYTPALRLSTPAYDPGLNRNADALPDHLEPLCNSTCTLLEAPRGDEDGDGINNALEAFLHAAGAGQTGDGDAYSDADADGVPDIIELHYGRWMDTQGPAVRRLHCDAGAYLVRLAACAAELTGMSIQVAMNSRGRGIYRGGARGLAGMEHVVDAQTRLGSGTHWLLSPDGEPVELQLRPLLALSGSEAVVLASETTRQTLSAVYRAAVLLQGPLPRETGPVTVSVCRLPAAPDFTAATGFSLDLCPAEGMSLRLDTSQRQQTLTLEWQVSRTEDTGKTLRLSARVAGGAEPVSGYSFRPGAVQSLLYLEARLLFPDPQVRAAGARQKLVPFLVDVNGEHVGSAENGASWHFRTEPGEGVAGVTLVCAVSMGGANGPFEKRFRRPEIVNGEMLLEEVENFANRVVRVEFYRGEEVACRARSAAGEEFLGEISFLVGEEDRDGNLVPDAEEDVEAPVDATGKKGLRYRPGEGDGEGEYYLRSRLSLRLGTAAAEGAMGTPNLFETGEEGLESPPPDALQAVDGVVLDFETFCAEDPGCLQAGEPVRLVFELVSDIPEDARYYKLRKNVQTGATAWCPLVLQYENGLPETVPAACPQVPENYRGWDGLGFAAHEASGECPAPGSEAYQVHDVHPSGARYLDVPLAGEHCLQLTLIDNGPNDDNPLSGIVADPGGVFARVTATPADTASPPAPPVPAPPTSNARPSANTAGDASGGGGGGGGSLGWLALLLLAALTWGGLWRKRPALH